MLDEGLDIHVPVHINAYLREYQRDGIEFFYKLFKEGRGGVLGDDMGLVRSRGLTQIYLILLSGQNCSSNSFFGCYYAQTKRQT